METVIIEIAPGKREIYPYLPRDPKESDGNLRFYAETRKGWRVFTIEAIRPFGGWFVDDVGEVLKSPFPDCPPKEIAHCRLLAPPVYEDEEHAKLNRPENLPDYPPHVPKDCWGWDAIYQKTHGEALWPKPEHEGELRGAKRTRKGGPIWKLLVRIRWEARADRRRDVATWEKELRRRSEIPFEELKHTNDLQKQQRVKEAFHQVEATKNYWRQIEALSLADFKRGFWPGEEESPLRDFLVLEWAQSNNVDMAAMEKDAAACDAWIKIHCRNTAASVQHHESGLGGLHEIRPELVPDRWDFFECLLARVRYKVTFQNGTILYLINRNYQCLRTSEKAEVGSLCPEHDNTDEGLARIVRQVLMEMKPEIIDHEIIRLWFNEGLSYDKIVGHLRKNRRGKSKPYVAGVIQQWRSRMENKGIKPKCGMGSGIEPPKTGFDNDGRRTPITTRSASSKLEQEELVSILARWPNFSQEEQKHLLDEYPELRRHTQNGQLNGDAAKQAAEEELASFKELN